jgi:hypothetical protein
MERSCDEVTVISKAEDTVRILSQEDIASNQQPGEAELWNGKRSQENQDETEKWWKAGIDTPFGFFPRASSSTHDRALVARASS